MNDRHYLCIDLKSFYASVECVERGLDPMTTNLVVADPDRSRNTICLAITPAMKALGVKNRCRVFEIPGHIRYITAPPRMKKYIDYSAEIYGVYLDYISKDDIHVYSIDEAFLDVTGYLKLYKATPRELGVRIMDEIYKRTGVRATCGIGSNLYLTKIALDIEAKHAADFIGELDEDSYCQKLWEHEPLTDFWRIGPGTAKHLARYGIHNMEGIAHMDEELLYKQFGIDAELLIDHAWGRETTTMQDIKNYRPRSSSLSSGQVLMRDYAFGEARIVAMEMMDMLCLDLVDKKLVTSDVSLWVSYSRREMASPAKGRAKLDLDTNSDHILVPTIGALFDRIVRRDMPIRRINISCNKIVDEVCVQYSFFRSPEEVERDRNLQRAVSSLKKRYGKNAVLKGMNYLKGATARERNMQIGGHKSGEGGMNYGKENKG